jgi:hypothetical protein
MGLGIGKIAAIGALGAAGAMGVANRVGPAMREGAMETAFGDPNADAAFLGRNVSARFLLGSAIGGPMGGAMRYSAPDDYFMVDPASSSTFGMGLGALGAVGGGSIGYGATSMVARTPRKTIRNAVSSIGREGGKGFSLGGTKTRIAGAIAGAAAGAAILPASYVRGHIGRNQQFYDQSPYNNVSLARAEALNASGDIVLGMHNSRGG